MRCDYFEAGVCRSCELMGVPYERQLAEKDAVARDLLAARSEAEWLPPVPSAEAGFRNKAKMVVGGTVDAPTLGILDATWRGVDLRDCGVLAPGLRAALGPIAEFMTTARLPPYDVDRRRGELKHVLLTESPDGELMLRFVLRSTEALGRIRKHLSALLALMPRLSVVSANLQSEPKAIIEGPEEVVLHGDELPMRVGETVLHLHPGAFFQTNTAIAAALYAQAREWADAVGAVSVWDLYCGVGGFALALAGTAAEAGNRAGTDGGHRGSGIGGTSDRDDCTGTGRRVTGIETSTAAVAAARASARESGRTDVEFVAADATGWVLAHMTAPDLVVLNPPRRGVGPELCAWLERSGPRSVIYSSCNPESLARDLDRLGSYAASHIRLFDMFPQTRHAEVMVLLERR